MQTIKSKIYDWLRWSERYLKTDMVYLTKGGFWVTFGQVTTNVLSFLLVIIFANYLPKETYGLYRYVLSLASILNIFTLTGMNQAVSQAVATGDQGALKTSVKYQLKWHLMMLAAFWVLSGYYLINNNWFLASSLFILSLFSPLTAAFNTYGAFLEGKREFRLNNIFSIISTFIYVIGLIVAVMLSGKLVWLVIAYSLTTFGATLFFYLLTLRRFSPPATSNNKVLKYGRELTYISLFGTAVSQVDSIILNHFWGPTQLAVYSLSMAIPGRVTTFVKSWANIGLPKISTRTPEEINQVFYRKIVQGLIAGAIITLAYVTVAPYVFKYLLPQYLDTVFYSQLLAISFIFALPNRYISLIFTAQKLSRLIFINSLVQNIIRLSLFIVLGIFGGIYGLVWGQVLNSFISFFINIGIWRFTSQRPSTSILSRV